MKLLFLSILAACSLTVLSGCADNNRQTTMTSEQSSSVDTKNMQPVHQ